MFIALLDTCVLWPSVQRDFLLSLSFEQLYRPIWSSAILEELEFEETKKLVERGANEDEAAARARRLIEQMTTHFSDSLVDGWEGLEGSYGLPDEDDEHVVAAAVVGNAGAIVTANLKDFPATCLPAGLDVVSPADFAFNTVSLDPLVAWRAIDLMAARSGRRGRQRSGYQILDDLEARYTMGEVADLLRVTIRP